MDNITEFKSKIEKYQFKKGKSGNPAGRPKRIKPSEAYEAKLEELAPLALKRIEGILRDESAPTREVRAAADSVLDRMYGKATQKVETTLEKFDYSKFTVEELERMRDEANRGVEEKINELKQA